MKFKNDEEKVRAWISYVTCYQRSVALFDAFRPHLVGFIEGKQLTTDENRRAAALASYWFGSLYVLVEGWQTFGFRNPDIDLLLSDPRVDVLRRYRNFVFHFQPNYADPRSEALFAEGQDALNWALVLATKLNEILLPHYDKPDPFLLAGWLLSDDPNIGPRSA